VTEGLWRGQGVAISECIRGRDFLAEIQQGQCLNMVVNAGMGVENARSEHKSDKVQKKINNYIQLKTSSECCNGADV
jgi:hypothetical protein